MEKQAEMEEQTLKSHRASPDATRGKKRRFSCGFGHSGFRHAAFLPQGAACRDHLGTATPRSSFLAGGHPLNRPAMKWAAGFLRKNSKILRRRRLTCRFPTLTHSGLRSDPDH